MLRMIRPLGCTLLFAAALAACGDPDTTDDRGYTKAPLEKPFPIIGGQERSPMDELGDPNRLDGDELEFPEPATTGG